MIPTAHVYILVAVVLDRDGQSALRRAAESFVRRGLPGSAEQAEKMMLKIDVELYLFI